MYFKMAALVTFAYYESCSGFSPCLVKLSQFYKNRTIKSGFGLIMPTFKRVID
jgi:hypothetical protein